MKRACSALALTRATAYRHLRPLPPRVSRPRRPNHRRLSQAERGAVLELLDSERFIDQPPREVYATLLEEGTFLCSIRTMYRVLRERGELRDRRDHREREKHAVPRLVATAPNQVWTWDISKLATLVSGVFLNLYVVLDLFSRYVVAWMVAERENSALAQQLFAEAIFRYGIEPGKLVVHQDRGAPMTAHGFAELLSALGSTEATPGRASRMTTLTRSRSFTQRSISLIIPVVSWTPATVDTGVTTSSAGTTTTTTTKGSTSLRPQTSSLGASSSLPHAVRRR